MQRQVQSQSLHLLLEHYHIINLKSKGHDMNLSTWHNCIHPPFSSLPSYSSFPHMKPVTIDTVSSLLILFSVYKAKQKVGHILSFILV